MKYIAVHYVKIAGHMKTPGEIFDAELQPQKEERLLRLGAILRDEAPSAEPVPAKKTAPDNQPPPEPHEDDEDEAEDEGGYEEADDDAPEIDVMDGLVQAQESEKPKAAPKPKTRAKAKPKA